ncbi:MAG: phage tail sheath C-terminal domain-containing protein [Desulfobulbus sp.]|jgi:hypothetical protein
MSESISEMILPGTYIDVRAEGLIGVGGIAVGNIGIVGSAAKGPRNKVVAIGNMAEAVDAFGEPDAWGDGCLSLVRTIQMALQGGGKNIYAVRIANGEPVQATATILGTGDASFTMSAREGGSYGNQIHYAIDKVDLKDGKTNFVLTLTYRNIKETHEGKDIGTLREQIAAASNLVEVGEISEGSEQEWLRPVISQPLYIKHADGSEEGVQGLDHANVTAVDLEEGLAVLVDEPVNILLAAGFDADNGADKVLAHLEETENCGKERIALLGTSAADPDTVADEADGISDDRVVLVAPGLITADPVSGAEITCPPSYLAAVVAGKLSTLGPHISLTNKEVAIKDLSLRYNETITKKLLDKGMLLVRPKFGKQIVRAITSQDGPFKQISIRRVVDYAKAGVRRGSDPYIGRLNNARVRAALKATLDGFLSQMVMDEMLVGYTLEVSATRSQEINGIAAVTMTLMPTFSIDYIRVTMNLG